MRPGSLRVPIYVAAVGVAAATLLLMGDWRSSLERGDFWNAFAVMLGLALLGELFYSRLSVGTVTSAVSFVPYLASIVLLGTPWAMAVAGTTELVAEVIIRRKETIKVVLNTAKEITAIAAAGALYELLGGVPSASELNLVPVAFGAAATTYFLISNGAVATAVALSSGTRLSESWARLVGRTLISDLFASALALILASVYVELQLLGALLVIIPLFFIRRATQVNLQLEQANRDLLELMVKAIEARDPYTSGHSQRVAKLAGALAREVGLGLRNVEIITTAALLHDVGKIYEEFAALLRKEGKLTESERRLMESHPARSAELVSTISSLRGAVERCVRHHHEHFDGSGYPGGLAGEEIPLGARIIMIADTIDAMTTDRPYRRALPYDRVVAELERYSGYQFDPRLVDSFRGSATLRALVATHERDVPTSIVEKPRRWRLHVANESR